MVLPSPGVVVGFADLHDAGGLPSHHVDVAEHEVAVQLADCGSHQLGGGHAHQLLVEAPEVAPRHPLADLRGLGLLVGQQASAGGLLEASQGCSRLPKAAQGCSRLLKKWLLRSFP